MKPILSKSTFIYGCQCPKRLYLHKYHSELTNPEDEQQQAIFKRGTDVGELAQQLFPGGVNAQGNEAWHSQVTVNRTQKLLPVYAVIYEAAFMFEGVLCAVDILVRKGKKYYAYEVKSTNSAKSQHVLDAALQYYVLKGCGLDIADFNIIHFNRDYIKVGPIEHHKLFAETSVLEQVIAQQLFVHEKVVALKHILQLKRVPSIAMGDQCNSPYPCNFSDYCSSLIPTVSEEPEVNNDIFFDIPSLKSFVKGIIYPLYFFDFETVMYGVPEYDFTSPYQQIPFQYSLHIQKSRRSHLTHTHFLGDGMQDPRLQLCEQLVRDLGTIGTILVWSKPFEKGCLEKLARDFPEYAFQIEQIINRLEDLMIPFKQKMVTSDAFYNSSSIKNVLPVMVPELSYQNLEIKEGGMASFMYGQLRELNEMNQLKVRQNLLEYCHLDTLAMVKIWEKLMEKIQS
jgi:hypothetical protein